MNMFLAGNNFENTTAIISLLKLCSVCVWGCRPQCVSVCVCVRGGCNSSSITAFASFFFFFSKNQ